MTDDIVKKFNWESICAVGGEKIETGVLWPKDSDEQWFVCETHLPLLQTKSTAIEFKNSVDKLMEDFRKKQ